MKERKKEKKYVFRVCACSVARTAHVHINSISFSSFSVSLYSAKAKTCNKQNKNQMALFISNHFEFLFFGSFRITCWRRSCYSTSPNEILFYQLIDIGELNAYLYLFLSLLLSKLFK